MGQVFSGSTVSEFQPIPTLVVNGEDADGKSPTFDNRTPLVPPSDEDGTDMWATEWILVGAPYAMFIRIVATDQPKRQWSLQYRSTDHSFVSNISFSNISATSVERDGHVNRFRLQPPTSHCTNKQTKETKGQLECQGPANHIPLATATALRVEWSYSPELHILSLSIV